MQGYFSPFAVYGRAKLAMLMCTFALDRRLVQTNVTVNALHPGIMATDIIGDVRAEGTSVVDRSHQAVLAITDKRFSNGARSSDLERTRRCEWCVLQERSAGDSDDDGVPTANSKRRCGDSNELAGLDELELPLQRLEQ